MKNLNVDQFDVENTLFVLYEIKKLFDNERGAFKNACIRKGGAVLGNACEDFALTVYQREWPENLNEHPADRLGLPDILSKKTGKGLEIKFTFQKNCQWSNGALANRDKDELFLFVWATVKKGKLIYKEAYLGRMNYLDWTQRPGTGKTKSRGLTTYKSTVEKYCVKII